MLLLLTLQLNTFFAWTSRVGVTRKFHYNPLLRLLVVSEVDAVTRVQLSIPAVGNYFSNLASAPHRPAGVQSMLEMKLFIDCEVIGLVIAIFVISFLLFHSGGIGVSLLRALEITALSILPLGLEIYLYDPVQFNIHASDIQVKVGLAWFTNSDVLYVSSSILTITLLIELLKHRKSKRETEAQSQKVAMTIK